MQLKLSETGSILAELGIIEARSSVTNCILYGEMKHSQLMIGSLDENQSQIDYIIRVAGVSPIVAMVTAISRKLFVYSSWLAYNSINLFNHSQNLN